MIPENTIKIIKSLLITSIPLMMLSGCGTWKIQDSIKTTNNQISSDKIAVIERMEGRKSPPIKTFRHFGLGIYKESGGSRHNDYTAPDRVETPPGRVQIGVTFSDTSGDTIYYPEVEFIAKPGHKYGITWLCVISHILVIVDMESSYIVGVDSYYPRSDRFIGKKLLQSSECTKVLSELPMPGDQNFKERWKETYNHSYKNLCYAAKHGVTSAQFQLGINYSMGLYGFPKDKVRSYVWYQKALESDKKKNSLSPRDSKNLKRDIIFKKKNLSPKQLEEAQRLLSSSTLRQCEERPFRTLQQHVDHMIKYGWE